MASPVRVIALVLLALLPALARGAAPTPVWFRFTPAVIDVREPEDVRFEVQTTGGAEAATLHLPPGTDGRSRLVIHLESLGSGRFGTTLRHAQALHDYQPDADVMHNFVGNLELYQGGQSTGSIYNLFINVSDGTFGTVPLRALGTDMQASPRVVNIVGAFDDPSRVDLTMLARRFYERFADDYDFLNFLFHPEFFENRTHSSVRNAVQGIGMSLYDRGATYGSRQRLVGFNRFPVLSYFDMGERAALHEIGHQWMQHMDLPALHGVRPHWPASSLAYGIMGYQTQLQGLDLTFTIEHIGGDEYRWRSAAVSPDFNDMELYLMGLLPREEVQPHVVPTESRPICHGCPTGPVTVVTVEDVIRRYGHRLPEHETSPKHFRVATIVISNHLLSAREMSFLDHFAARGEATTPLPYSSGRTSGTSHPWHVATGRRSTLSTTLD